MPAGVRVSVSGGRIDLFSTVSSPLIRPTYVSGSSAINLDVSLLQNSTISTAAGGTLEFSSFGAPTGNISLSPAVNFNPVVGNVFTLINKTSMGPISGTFGKSPQDGGITVNGKFLKISYTGGDGNDLTATFTGSPPVLSTIPSQVCDEDSHTGGAAFTINDADTPVADITLTATSSNPAVIDAGMYVAITASTNNRVVIVGGNPNRNGTSTITITADDGLNRVSTSFLATVNALNDAPSFQAGPDQTVPVNAGPQTVPWATSIVAGPDDEAGQIVTFDIAGNTNAALFSVAPAISPTGVLSYTPVPGSTGSSTIGVRLRDNGGPYQPGSGGNQGASFVITVLPATGAAPPRVVNFSSDPEAGGGRRIIMSVAAGAGLANRSALLQTSADLDVWNALASGTTDGSGGVAFNTVDPAGGQPRRYYRTKLP